MEAFFKRTPPTESQLSPLAPEFNPNGSSPEVSEGGDVELPADPGDYNHGQDGYNFVTKMHRGV